jgi:hypothetical protein
MEWFLGLSSRRLSSGALLLALLGIAMMPMGVAQGADEPEGPVSVPALSGEGSAPPPAAQEDEPAQTGEGAGSDWDWGAGWEAPAETAVTAPRRKAANRHRLANKPRVGETAEPDLEREPVHGHALFAGAAPFWVIPSKKDPDIHPCADCHEWAESDLTPRALDEPHDNFALQHGLHGKGEFWCFTCHHLDGDGGIRTIEGEKLDFDDAYVVCAQCHARQAKDWSYGAHGKRIGNWAGERRILNCTACHYQHRPAIKGRRPKPPPPVRKGLTHNHPKPPPHERPWERYQRVGRAGEPRGESGP